MALRCDRNYNDLVDISFFSSQATEERGVIMVHASHSAGSGAAMDQGEALVLTPTGLSDGSGSIPAGLLLNDIVNVDLSKYHLNAHKDEVQLGGKVTLLRRGTVVTNMIAAGVSPTVGAKAYYDADGKLDVAPTSEVTVGRFLSTKDADGYAKVEINIV